MEEEKRPENDQIADLFFSLGIIKIGIFLLTNAQSSYKLKTMNILNQSSSGLSEKEAKEILRPHMPNLYGCIADGWHAWETLGQREPGLRKPLNAMARAYFIYCHIVESAKKRFSEIPNVRLSEKKRFLTITFGREVTLRFKKLDSKRRARGTPTKQFLLFMNQQYIPGLEPTQINLVGGYTLNDVQAEINEILITCPMGATNKWDFVLDAPLEQERIQNITPKSVEEKPIIRPIKVRKEKGKSG